MAANVTGKKVKSGIIADWDACATEIFCKICVEEVEAGNRPYGGLTAKGYQNLVQKFVARAGRSYTKKQMKNCWDALKRLYDFSLSLEHTTGIGWDSTLRTYTTSDEFGRTTQRSKERRAIRFGPLPNLNELEIMFEKSKVSGLSACIPGQAEPSSPKNLDDMNNIDDEGTGEFNITPKPVSRGTKRKRKSRSPKNKGKNPTVRVMSKMVDDVISTNSTISKAFQDDFTCNDIRQVLNLAKESGAVEGSHKHYIATRLFVKSEN